MKIVILERNSVGRDIPLDGIEKLGETVVYPNTTALDVKEKIKDAEIIVANKVPLNEETLKDASDVKLICEFATGYDNVDLNYCKNRGIKVANIVGFLPMQWHSIPLHCAFMYLKSFATMMIM